MITKINTHEPEGDGLSDEMGVSSIPHFILMRPDGEIVDRWVGYGAPDAWLELFDGALADPATLAEKEARFASAPTPADAGTLARVRAAESRWADAAKYLAEADRLDPAGAVARAVDRFEVTFRGFRDDVFTFEDVRAAADAIKDAASARAEDAVAVARVMARLAKDRGEVALMIPYLARALSATEGTTDEDLASDRRGLLVLEALHVAKDVDRAIALKKESMRKGWMDSPEELNAFAWWCFENRSNLEEAEALARRGVEKAGSGTEKAQILDTVAEIVAARGDFAAASELSALAAREDPASAYYPKQKVRFDDLAKGKAS